MTPDAPTSAAPPPWRPALCMLRASCSRLPVLLLRRPRGAVSQQHVPAMSAHAAAQAAWTGLNTTQQELRLDATLPTGQSFRWRCVRPGEYVGVVAGQVYHMRQGGGEGATESSDGGGDDVFFRRLQLEPPPGDVALALPRSQNDDMAALREYFTLDTRLTDLHAHFASMDPRFAALLPYVAGARLLRQPPVECLFAFICSSNNNVKRITGMVDRLCVAYGTHLGTDAWGHTHFSFPTLQQLASADEAQLRDLGFGYRAKFITGAAQQLAARPGGQAWLEGLRAAAVPSADAVRQLAALPGVGPKVAACAALFSLDKHDCIPVDTHVWQFACAHYPDAMLLLPPAAPRKKKAKTEPSTEDAAVAGASETPAQPACTLRTMGAVAQHLQQLWGPYAGWAHTACFIVELADQRTALPPELRTPKAVTPAKVKKEKGTKRAAPAPAGVDADST